MKSYNLRDIAFREGGEYVLGLKDLHTHACYMIYGILEPGESGRVVRPGGGHEEILCAVSGSIILRRTAGDAVLEEGCAVHVTEDESFHISNPSDQRAVYIMAGGHSGHHHHGETAPETAVC
jgi:hypothetical protein